MSPHITLRDIAVFARVSPSTVSRALGNNPHIPEATRQRIRDAARQLGYHPNPYVKAFTTYVRNHQDAGHRAIIAVLDITSKSKGHADNTPVQIPFWVKNYLTALERRAEDIGFRIDLFRCRPEDREMKRLNQILKSRGIHGLVILPPRENELPPGLDFSGLSTATIDLSLRSPDLPRTSPDYFAGAVLAMKTLRRKGYRRIGFCTNLEELHRIGDRWLGGVLFAQHSFPAEEQILPYITPEAKSQKMTEFWQEMRGDFFRWLDRCRPDVLLSNCLYFYQWAEESGRRIPGQIGFASLSSDMPTVSENDISIRHPVSGVDQQNEKVAARALDLVANRIYNNEFGLIPDPEMVLIPPVWRDGATLRP